MGISTHISKTLCPIECSCCSVKIKNKTCLCFRPKPVEADVMTDTAFGRDDAQDRCVELILVRNNDMSTSRTSCDRRRPTCHAHDPCSMMIPGGTRYPPTPSMKFLVSKIKLVKHTKIKNATLSTTGYIRDSI